MVGFLAERTVFLDQPKTVWDTSPPEHSEECTMTYSQGLLVNQGKYVHELQTGVFASKIKRSGVFQAGCVRCLCLVF